MVDAVLQQARIGSKEILERKFEPFTVPRNILGRGCLVMTESYAVPDNRLGWTSSGSTLLAAKFPPAAT